MIALGEKNIQDLSFVCELDGNIVEPLVIQREHPFECKWSAYLIDCKTDTQPSVVSLIGPNKAKHQVNKRLNN
jgi:hypothetical protein